MPKHPTISLCMIVRDEEEHLPRCLASAKDLVDEIIVVDTGSKALVSSKEDRLWSRLRRLLRTYNPDQKELDLEAVATKIYQEAHEKGNLGEEGALILLAYECLRRISREETNYE